MLLVTDSHVFKDVTHQYCLMSLLTYLSASFILYWTDLYLLAGRREHLHVLFVFTLIEVIKYIYIKIILEKDVRITYKKRALPFFSLFAKCFDVVHLFKTVIYVIIGSFTYHLLAVFFGADFFDRCEDTFMFSLHMSILTVLPMYLNFGFSSLAHIIAGVKPGNCLQQLIYRSAQSAVFGAWCGAVVIPLDWRRPWQVWPIPCSYAALLGSTAAYLVMYCHMVLLSPHISLLFKKK